jgi:hypothetical protein
MDLLDKTLPTRVPSPMLSYLVLGIGLLSLVLPGVLTLSKGTLPLSLALWLGGMVAGGMLVALSGVFWAQLANPEAFVGQGGGFAFVIVLPILIGAGLLTGAWAVAWGYWLAPPGSLLWFQLAGLVGSSAIGPPLVWGLAGLLGQGGLLLGLLEESDRLSPMAIAVCLGSCLTALLVHGFTRLLWSWR